MSTMSKLFIAHPAAVGESYFEHMKFAFKFSGPAVPGGFCRFRPWLCACGLRDHGIGSNLCDER